MNDEEHESSVLFRRKPATTEDNRKSPNGQVCHSGQFLKYVSAEIVTFCFVFVFYYYQFYTLQYFFQWYAIKALRNMTVYFNHSVCYSQTLITELSGSNSTINEVEANAAQMNMIITITMSVPSLVVNLVISPLSDKYGRKPVMMLVLVSEFLAVVVVVIVTYLNLNIYWFILSALLIGFGGSVSTSQSVSLAYVSDITPTRWRTLHIGFLQAMVYTGVASSSGIFNIWLQHAKCDFRYPCWLMVVVAFAGFLYSVVLPESLPKQERIQLNQYKNGIKVLIQGVKIFFWPRLGYSLLKLWCLAIPVCIVVFSESGETAIGTLFQLHKPLEWSRNLIGIYGIVRASTNVVVLFVILPLLLLLKLADPLIVIIGIVGAVGGNTFVGFVKYTWEMFVALLLIGMESLLLPSFLSMSSKIVRPEDQGALYSFLTTFSLLSSILGSMVYSLVYPFTLQRGLPPGSSFWLMAIIWAMPTPFVLLMWLLGRKKNDYTSTSTNDGDIALGSVPVGFSDTANS